MTTTEQQSFREYALQVAAKVSLWPEWKRNVLGSSPPLLPRPIEITEGVFTDIVPTEVGEYWLKNRHTGHERISYLYPELGLDWTHYWMAGPKVLTAEESLKQ